MKFLIIGVCCCTLLLSCTSNTTPGNPNNSTKSLTTEKDKFSYSIGREIGSSLQTFKDEIDLTALVMGISDTLANKKSPLADSILANVRMVVMKRLQDQYEAKMSQEKSKNSAASTAFFEKNKNEKDVLTTSSGLQYKIIKEGTGETPKATDKVKVHYKGTLLDGKEFDSSYGRNEPAVFPVNAVIPGWSEGLQLMKVGGSYKLFVPSALAYGERGVGDKISPNSALIFEVELLEIVKE